MDEKVAAAVIWSDEAEALVVAEPLDSSRCHVQIPSALRANRRVPLWPRAVHKKRYQGAKVDLPKRPDASQRSSAATAAISSMSPGAGVHGSQSGSPM